MRIHSAEIFLPAYTNVPHDIMPEIRKAFSQVHDSDMLYRASGVTLSEMRSVVVVQQDFFGNADKTGALRDVFRAVDMLTSKYGDGAVSLGSSFKKFPNQQATIFRRLPLPFHGMIAS